MGYAPHNKKCYNCYNPVTRKTMVSMDVSFFEDQNISWRGRVKVLKKETFGTLFLIPYLQR